jgi:hypothetical protein
LLLTSITVLLANVSALAEIEKPLVGDVATPIFVVQQHLPAWLENSLSADKTHISHNLNAADRSKLVSLFGGDVTAGKPDLAAAGFEAVAHSAGANYPDITVSDAIKRLSTKQGHGILWEKLVADAKSDAGHTIWFTKPKSLSTDLTDWDPKTKQMTFLQPKAMANASDSARESFLDGLAFVGRGEKDALDILSGTKHFSCPIPSDEYSDLLRQGKITDAGTPTKDFAEAILKEAKRRGMGSGLTAERLKNASQSAERALLKVRVEPGPYTYRQLLDVRDSTLVELNYLKPKVSLSRALQEQQVNGLLKQLKCTPFIRTLGPFLVKVTGALGVGVGIWQVHEGFVEYNDGKRAVGIADICSGTLTSLSGGAAVRGSLRASGVLAGGAIAIDGVRDVYVGYETHNGELAFIGSIKFLAGGAIAVGSATANAPAVIVGTAAYVVIVVYESREALGRISASVLDEIAHAGRVANEAVKHVLRNGEEYAIDYFSLETQDRVLALTPSWVKNLYFNRIAPYWRN